MLIRPAKTVDASSITDIYNHYVRHSIITFVEDPIPVDEIKTDIETATSNQLPYLVAEIDKQVLGYAYASKWKGRCAYRHSVEVTVYLSPKALGEGIGSKLYQALFTELKEKSIHVVLAGIALPNPESIALHEKFGMEKAAHFKEVGYKFNKWVDVAYWQIIFQN